MWNNIKELPKKISPCPIIEVIFEIFFDTKIPPSAILGMIYPYFKDEYEDLEKLSFTQLPDSIRSLDQNLMFKADYKMKTASNNYIIQVGPKMLSISNINEYSGWTVLQNKLNDFTKKIEKSGIIQNIRGINIRYINFFDIDIFEHIKLTLTVNDKIHLSPSTVINTRIKGEDNLDIILQVANNATLNSKTVSRNGSIINIATILKKDRQIIFDNDAISEFLESAHIKEKKIFFNLLKDEYLKKLNPEY